MRNTRPAAAAVLAAATLVLAGCGAAVDENGATSEDRAAFALAWSQQSEADKDNACVILAVQGEHGVALNATKMDRPHVFAAILADTCEKEGR